MGIGDGELTCVVATGCLCGALLATPLGQHQPVQAVVTLGDPACAAAAWAEAHADRARLFGATSKGDGYDPEQDRWREYPTRASLQKDAAGGNLFYRAAVWAPPTGGLFVRTEETSFSGDWGLYVDYCFRASGVVETIESSLRLLPSRADTRTSIVFDGEGRESGRRTTHRDLRTDAVLSGQAAQKAQRYAVIPTPIYKRASELPFYEMLARRK